MAGRLRERMARILRTKIRNPFMPVHWDEPYRFTRMIRRLDTEKFTPVQLAELTMATSALLMLSWFVAHMSHQPGPGKQPLSFGLALLVSVAGSLFLVGFLYLVYLFAPRTIGLNKKEILCIQGDSQRRWQYDKISGIRFDTMQCGDKQFTVMFVDLRDGKDLVFGVSKKANLPETVAFLRGAGVEVVEKPWRQAQHASTPRSIRR